MRMTRPLGAATIAALAACGSAAPTNRPLPSASVEEILGPVVRDRVAHDFDGMTTDTDLAAYLRRVAARLSPVLQRLIPSPHELRVWVVNAGGSSCFPVLAGDVLVSRGLVMFCDNEDQLAAVILGEAIQASLGNARSEIFRHVPRTIDLTAAAAEIRSGRARHGQPAETAPTWIAVEWLARGVSAARFTADQEDEADHHIIRMLVEANYNPMAHPILIRRFLNKEVDSGGYSHRHRLYEARAGTAERRIREHFAGAAGRQWETKRFDQGTRRAEAVRKAFALIEHGESALALGHTDLALKHLNQAVEMRADPFFLLARGRARMAGNQPAEAEADFSLAIQRTHKIESLFRARARARHAQGNYSGAASDLAEAVDLVRRIDSFLLLGECEERQNRFPAARVAYVNCLALCGFDPGRPPPSGAAAEARQAFERLEILRGR
jgi:predicted Zn-dependent protease